MALADTKRSLPDHIQKKMFIQGEAAEAPTAEYGMRALCSSSRLWTFRLDLSRYQEQSEKRDRITSGKMVTGWLRSDEQLAREVEEVRARQG